MNVSRSGVASVNPAQPSFWDQWYEGEELPRGWDELGAKERCVLAHAEEEAFLWEVIGYFLGVPVESPSGHAWEYSDDVAAIRAQIPEFAAIVGDMIARGRVEIREIRSDSDQFDDAPPLDQDQANSVLADTATWTRSRDGKSRPVRIAKAGRPESRLISSDPRC
jgi:hypothetical protein